MVTRSFESRAGGEPILYRSYGALVSADGAADRRTIFGIVCPFNQVVEIRDSYGGYLERFAAGAFRKTINEAGARVKLLRGHDARSLPVGRAVELREQPNGLYGAFRVAETAAGDELLTLVRDGVADAFSVGFRPIREREQRTDSGMIVVRTEVQLMEVSVVALGAYPSALIAGIRSADSGLWTHGRRAAYLRGLEPEELLAL
ncbi:HK97 family phage prohead protease [Streptomyces sp. NPDC057430]|uniref:HK97 family phage prohead protease n=1 Tax=Streptomyces sp. NPDC057430 TaxID=3346131 RepID=UPI0036CDD534